MDRVLEVDMLQSVQRPARRETKAEVFKRLASQRTNAVLEKLRILGNCANGNLYDYTDEDVRRVFRVIETEVRRTKAKFSDTKKERFEL
jgi:hypothetical protein